MTPVRPPVSAGNNSAESKETAAKSNPRQAQPPLQSAWLRELARFMNQPVTVQYMVGDQCCLVVGILRSFNHMSMHCVIDTPEECVMVRLPLEIRRPRKAAK